MRRSVCRGLRILRNCLVRFVDGFRSWTCGVCDCRESTDGLYNMAWRQRFYHAVMDLSLSVTSVWRGIAWYGSMKLAFIVVCTLSFSSSSLTFPLVIFSHTVRQYTPSQTCHSLLMFLIRTEPISRGEGELPSVPSLNASPSQHVRR
jgi:hypothetical protein